MALYFMVSSVVHVWEFVYDLSAVGGSYQLHQPLILSYSVVHLGAV
jgi:hypothetical protein